MSLRVTRLSLGEWLLGAGAVALLVDLFAATWFEYRPQYHATATMLGQRVSANGWQTFDVIGPLALVVCVAGAAVWLLGAGRHSPALPVVIATLLLPLSFALAVLVAIRVLLDQPSVHLAQAGAANVIEARPGAYVGLALSVLVFIGNYLTLRRENVAPDDSPASIVRLDVERSRTSPRP